VKLNDNPQYITNTLRTKLKRLTPGTFHFSHQTTQQPRNFFCIIDNNNNNQKILFLTLS
jgi:hypothetical protein